MIRAKALAIITLALMLAIGPMGGLTANAATAPVDLRTAASFAVLGGQTVTNTGPSTIVGNLGVAPGSAVTGFPPGLVSGGVIHAADAVALQAQSDLTTAYNDIAGRACNVSLTGTDLGGLTLVSGVYCFTSSAQLTGTLTLDAQGDPNAVFIFQIVSTLTTASNSTVQVINGGQSCNVYWQVGSSATVGTTTTFVGNILALTSIALQTGASVAGRALARNGSVTLDTNHVAPGSCQGGQPTDTTPPTCVLTAVIAGPPKQLKITVQDTGSGIGSIIVTTANNAVVPVPAFSVGTTSAIVVTATKINQSQGAQVALRVTDVAGNVIDCDPWITTLIQGKGKPATATFKNVPAAESNVTLMNETPGMDEVTVVVNGRRFDVDDLEEGRTVTLNVASAMRPGTANTIKVIAKGDRGASLTVVIH